MSEVQQPTDIDRFFQAYVRQTVETYVKYIPHICTLLAVKGLPAPWMAIGSIFVAHLISSARDALGGVERAENDRETSSKIAHIEAQLEEKLRAFQAEIDGLTGVVSEDMATVEYVDEMSKRLSDEQCEQIGKLLEEYLRTASEQWLKHLRMALRGTVRGSVDTATRKVIYSHLASLDTAHITSLYLISRASGDRIHTPTAGGVPGQELTTVEVENALVSVGFIEHLLVDGGLNRHIYSRTYRVTALGFAALKLLHDDEGAPPPL